MLTSRMPASPSPAPSSSPRSASAARKIDTPSGLRAIGSPTRRLQADASPSRRAPHLVLQQPAWAQAEDGRRKRNRESVKNKRGLKVRGEMKAMLGVLGVFGTFCSCGVVYLAAYAGVAAQSHQITMLQQQLNAAQAQHEVYVQQLTILSSASRIQSLATQQGMVMSGNAHYVTLTASGQDAADVSQVAAAR